MLAVADGLDNTFAGLKKKKKKQVSFGCGNYLILFSISLELDAFIVRKFVEDGIILCLLL